MRFEVRIPSYQRPIMLRRALESVRQQTYSDWFAIIFDDSSSSETAEVAQQYNDHRIICIHNTRRLGAAQNIDQCLSPSALVGGDYACLLEDDNFWLPDFLLLLKEQLPKGRWDLALANQRIHDEGNGLQGIGETTRGAWFQPGPIEPLQLCATLLLMEGLSNGGLVWKLGSGIDLRVGSSVRETALHEACRSLLVKEPFLFIQEPQAVWNSLPKQQTARAGEDNRIIARGMQSVRDYVLRRHGDDAISVAKAIAHKLSLTERLQINLAYSGHFVFDANFGRAAKAFAKGRAIKVLQKDPCSDFLKALAR